MDAPTHRLHIQLANGNVIVTEASFREDLDGDEIMRLVEKKLSGTPGWRIFEDAVVYSQAVPGILVEEL